MTTAVLKLPKTKLQTPVYQPTWSAEQVFSPSPSPTKTIAAKRAPAKKIKEVFTASFIACGAILLAGMNTSGAFFEQDWKTLLCIAPLALALAAIFVTWFSCFLFGDV